MRLILKIILTRDFLLLFYFWFAGSILTERPLIFAFFMASKTSFPYSLGTSTNVYLSYISMAPTSLPGMPDSPATAPKISPGFAVFFTDVDKQTHHALFSSGIVKIKRVLSVIVKIDLSQRLF